MLDKLKQSLFSKSEFRYLTAGGVAFTIDYISLVTAYYIFKLPLVLATTIGYFSGFIISFFANRYWVFGKSGAIRKPIKQILEYTLLVIFNYFFTIVAIEQLNKAGIKPSISKIMIMVVIVIWNYLIFQKFIFSDKGISAEKNQ